MSNTQKKYLVMLETYIYACYYVYISYKGGNHVEIRVLRYFLEVAKEENISKAAANLHLTQPTLSRQLKTLEEELGQKLFYRSNYSIHLTQEGKLLYKRAEDILRMVDRTSSEFEAMSEFHGGDIYIGCAESDGITYIAKAAKSLQEKYENLRFHLFSGNMKMVTEQLDKGLLDFAVVVQSVDVSKYDYMDIPYKDIWGLIMRKDSTLANKQTIDLIDLLDIPLIISRQGITREMPDWFQDNKKNLHIVATYDLLYNASILVREGVGYALGFDKLIDTGDSSALCFRPISPIIESSMRIIWKQHNILSKSQKLFFKELKKFI